MGDYREIHQQTEAGGWELARMAAPLVLRPWVKAYVGYREASPRQRLVRREVPSTVVGLIINFGSPFDIVDPRPNADWTARHTFMPAYMPARPGLPAMVMPIVYKLILRR